MSEIATRGILIQRMVADENSASGMRFEMVPFEEFAKSATDLATLDMLKEQLARNHALEEQVRHLTTALENARKDGWQPIETAPKDGTLVLVAEQGFVEVSHWHVWRLVRPAGASGVGAWVAPKSFPEEEYEIFQPTHWQPLPQPPPLTPPTQKAT